MMDFETMDDPYQVTIGGVVADPYRIARAYGLDATLGQALKKLLRCGRKHKDRATDVRECITTLERWEQMEAEDQQNAEAIRPATETTNETNQ
jgi:hypothetical protein